MNGVEKSGEEEKKNFGVEFKSLLTVFKNKLGWWMVEISLVMIL